MINESPKYPTANAIQRLNEMFHLTQYGQDWEIEVADSSRIAEFCDGYENFVLDSEGRFALMCLIIASYDEYLREYGQDIRDPSLEERISRLIGKDFYLHKHTLEYWCLHNVTAEEEDWDNPEWVFAVTPMMRKIWNSCQQR
ncbi:MULTISPECIES: hypothetical protein [Calothrix]|uniref:Uncharacterized protein n=2 Tax=Calothrix TaxID=1186 RepID=A0ABR8AE74_9CYAN|nr:MULTISPECIES: hypothetical protein [Calothrix]MBD2198335.1 hypothetical protein [Calothrix parietina FACHB-288]MBD2226660.1 hypothetical protein [Calothrix anomala FACHB-343]